MDNGIQLISDGDGLAVIGSEADVERFLVSEGLLSEGRGSRLLKSVAGTGAVAARAGTGMAAESGRWVKLTRESARVAEKHGLRESSKSGLSTGVVKGPKGQIKGFVEFAGGSRPRLGNPAALAHVAGIMAQLAMQQAMDEITDYLAAIDEKVDDVLRAQVGRVSEITWSKVQATPGTIAATQVYVLRRLDALVERMERKATVGELAETAGEAESRAQEWLAVLARCFQLQDAIAVLELDRVLDAAPEELERHRLGIRIARRKRLDLIARSTGRLAARMSEAAGVANAKVLLHPAKSPAVVRSSNRVVAGVHDFHGWLGIESGGGASEARRWAVAVSEVRDRALETGARASAPSEASPARPSTRPTRSRARSPARSPNEHAADAQTRRSALRRAESRCRPPAPREYRAGRPARVAPPGR